MVFKLKLCVKLKNSKILSPLKMADFSGFLYVLAQVMPRFDALKKIMLAKMGFSVLTNQSQAAWWFD